jgi:hypothetical protein
MTAKMVSKPHRTETREDWDDIRVAVMKWCLRVKLAQHWEEFGNALLRTGNLPIVEQSRKDPFWGAIPDESGEVLKGTNVLGRLLMELREKLKSTPAELRTVKPVPVDAFCLLGKPIEQIRKPVVAAGKVAHVVGARAADLFSAPREGALRKGAAPKRQFTMFDLPAQKKATKKSEKRNYRVVAGARGGWDVVREGGKRASAHFTTKSEALVRGRELARKARVDLIQFNKEGQAGQRVSYAEQTSLQI